MILGTIGALILGAFVYTNGGDIYNAIHDAIINNIATTTADAFFNGADSPSDKNDGIDSSIPMSICAELDKQNILNKVGPERKTEQNLRGWVIDNGKCGPCVYYLLDDTGTLTIYGYGKMNDYSSQPWDSNRENIKKVIIEEGVTSIRKKAFYNCTNLSSVKIPESVTSIGGYAFAYCTSLSSVEIPESVTYIEKFTFYHCTNLSSVVISQSITSIGGYAFAYCTSLSSVRLREFVLAPGRANWNFVHIPVSVTSIGQSAFEGCESLTEVALSGAVDFDLWVFRDCKNLEFVHYLGKNKISEYLYIFENCDKLNAIKVFKDYKYSQCGGKPVEKTFDRYR